MRHFLLSTLLLMAPLVGLQAATNQFQMPETHPTYKDVNYAGDTLESHRMDIYVPADGQATHKVVVVIYGSAWYANNMKAAAYFSLGRPLVDAGFAVVCINHRSSGDAHFPAQIHDVKAALRFVRAHAADYGLDTSFVGITGFSSGGHLASLAGVTCDLKSRTVGSTTIDLEGTVGDNAEQSSGVDAVVDWFGPVDMSRMENCQTPKDETSPEAALMGGAPADNPELVTIISPISYLPSTTPSPTTRHPVPFLVIHGDADNVVPHCQSEYFAAELKRVGRLADFITVAGGQHGPVTFNDTTYQRMTDFFRQAAGM